MRKNKITFLSTAMALVMTVGVMSSGVLAVDGTNNKSDIATTDRINGYRPVKKDVCVVEDTRKVLKRGGQDLPTVYRSDEQPWASGVRVKDQESSGLCWAFATTTAAEYSWAKESYEQYGTVKEMSPGHLGYFLFNRVNDPLGNTAGDKNLPLSDEGWPFFGGDFLSSMQHLATYSGLGLESNTPFSTIDLSLADHWDDSYQPFDDQFAYENYVTLQNSECFLSDFTTEELKKLIYDYGAVVSGITMDTKKYMNLSEKDATGNTYSEGKSFYNYETARQNHAITIVGWDDDYPATNFTHEITGMDSEKAMKKTTPTENGAWIVQNSWGAETNDKGFFYVSYDSADMWDDALVCAFDMQPADTYQYNFQYDGTADCGDSSDDGNEDFYTSANTSAANVYTNTTGKPIEIEAVGFTTYNYGTTVYNISIYKNLKNPNNPISGRLAGTTTTTTTLPGVKTAVLNQPVPINQGETYAVVFNFPEKAYFGVEKERDGYLYEVEINEGQSFFKRGVLSPWKDMADYDACFRIKALANEIEEYSEPEETTVEVTTEEKTSQEVTSEPTSVNSETTTGNPETQKQEVTTASIGENTTVSAVQSAKKRKVKLISVKGKKGRKAIVRWKKLRTVSGYQIRYSINRKFKKKVKKVLVGNANAYRKTIKKLKLNKRYYVQVRSFQKIKDKVTGKTKIVYGVWSNQKKVIVKK